MVAGLQLHEQANLYNDQNIFVMGSTHEEVSGRRRGQPDPQTGPLLQAEIERIIALSEPYHPAA